MINSDKHGSWELVWLDDNNKGVESIDVSVYDLPLITYRENEFKRQLYKKIESMLLNKCIRSVTSVDRRLSTQYCNAWFQRFKFGAKGADL